MIGVEEVAGAVDDDRLFEAGRLADSEASLRDEEDFRGEGSCCLDYLSVQVACVPHLDDYFVDELAIAPSE